MDYFLRGKFGGKVCKIPLDGGFTCPNRDGTKGVGGCSFCSERGSGDFAACGSITEQITKGAEMMRRKWKDAMIIPYFQAFTSTYAPLDILKKRFEEALSYPDISGLCVATRADCITDECAEYLHEDQLGYLCSTPWVGMCDPKLRCVIHSLFHGRFSVNVC